MPSARVSNAVKYEASISKCWHFLMYTMFLLSYVKWTFHAVIVKKTFGNNVNTAEYIIGCQCNAMAMVLTAVLEGPTPLATNCVLLM